MSQDNKNELITEMSAKLVTTDSEDIATPARH